MSVDSKTKSYQIQRGNFSLFIFLYQPPESALAGANPLSFVALDFCFRLLMLERQCLTSVLMLLAR